MKNGEEVLLKWYTTPKEFIYDYNVAPKGHLPLTAALRGKLLTLDPWVFVSTKSISVFCRFMIHATIN